MSANIDTLIYVGEVPWHRQGKDLTDNVPTNPNELVAAAELTWEVADLPIFTEKHNSIKNYRCIYRTDNEEALGLVNCATPYLVQNRDMFNAVEYLMQDDISVETAASLDHGRTVFGCFKMKQTYKLIDDEIDHYFIIVNDHLKVDGKITVLNSPVRVVCQNTLSEALNNNLYKLRVPISANDKAFNNSMATRIYESAGTAITALSARADEMIAKKVDDSYTDKLMDVLFPYHLVDGMPEATPANDKIAIIRDTFLSSCLHADNLANYQGTQWAIFNALTDFTQHYYKKLDHAYDINQRMKLVPGLLAATETNKVVQFLKIRDKIA